MKTLNLRQVTGLGGTSAAEVLYIQNKAFILSADPIEDLMARIYSSECPIWRLFGPQNTPAAV